MGFHYIENWVDSSGFGESQASWWDNNYKHRIPIKIKFAVPSTQRNFPMVIKDTIPELVGNVLASGDDIRFAIGETELNREIEYFNPLTGEIIAWFKVPEIFKGQRSYFYFSNIEATAPTDKFVRATWQKKFAGVYHTNNVSGAKPIKDSTSNGRDGISVFSEGRTPATLVDGQIDKAINLDGSSINQQFLSIPYVTTPSFFIAAWVKSNASVWNRSGMPFSARQQNGFLLHSLQASTIIQSYLFDKNAGISRDLRDVGFANIEIFNYMGMGYDSDLKLSTVTGNKQHPLPLPFVSTLREDFGNEITLEIGRDLQTRFGNIAVSEVHIYNELPTNDWQDTEYSNQKDPTAFYELGEIESIIPIDWYDERFKSRVVFTVKPDEVPSDQINFPTFVDFELPENIPNFQSINLIRFADENRNLLKYEIQELDTTTKRIIAHVKIPLLTTGTKIFMYFNGTNFQLPDLQDVPAVWTNGFESVYHMNQIPIIGTPSIKDSVDGSFATPNGGITQVDGQFGKALKFDGIDSQLLGKNMPSITNTISISVWLKTDWFSTKSGWIAGKELVNQEWQLFKEGINIILRGKYDTRAQDLVFISMNSVTIPNTFIHIVGQIGIEPTSSLSYMTLFIDSILRGFKQTTQDVGTGEGITEFGAYKTASGLGYVLDGTIDEIRISSKERVQDWVKTEYNMKNQSGFYSTEIQHI